MAEFHDISMDQIAKLANPFENDVDTGHVHSGPTNIVPSQYANSSDDILTDAYFVNLLNENSNDSGNDLKSTSELTANSVSVKDANDKGSLLSDTHSDPTDTLGHNLVEMCDINHQTEMIVGSGSQTKIDEIKGAQFVPVEQDTEGSIVNNATVTKNSSPLECEACGNTNTSEESVLIGGSPLETKIDEINDSQSSSVEQDTEDRVISNVTENSSPPDTEACDITDTGEVQCEIDLSLESRTEQKIDKCVPVITNGHREIEDWTDDESASSTSSSDSDAFLEDLHRASTPKIMPVKTKGELDIEDLPPIEELSISVEKNELTKIGKIHAIVTKQVIVQALKDQKPLDMDSVLFLAADKPLGRVFEVFGPVVEPFYIVLFNSPEDIINKGVTLDADVYFAPEKNDITTYIFVDVLRQQKGSDASWKDNNEPPEEYLDYSDDEQERAAKLKRRGKNRNREDDDDIQIISKRGCSSNKTSPVSEIESRRIITPLKKFPVRGHSFTSNSSENVFRRNYNTGIAPSGTPTSTNFKFTFSHPSPVRTSRPLDNVPVWISSPPPFLEAKPLSFTKQNIYSTPPPQSFSSPQQAGPIHHPVHKYPSVSGYSPQQTPPESHSRLSPLVLYPNQPYVSLQQPNLNSSPVVFPPQNPFTPTQRSSNYGPSPQPPVHQQVQQNQHIFQNYSQAHVFGQITPVAALSPAVSFSTPVFNPSPSPSVYASPSPVIPTNFFASTPPPPTSEATPNRYWQSREQMRSPFAGMQSPPLNTPLSIQIPTFTNLPPLVRFTASNSCAIPPPQPPPNNNASQRYHPPPNNASQQFRPPPNNYASQQFQPLPNNYGSQQFHQPLIRF